MSISAFFCFAEPDRLRYPYVESVSSVLDFCDEVVILFAASADPSGRRFEGVSFEALSAIRHPTCEVRVLPQAYWPGWADNTYENTRRLLKLGFDSCQGDVVLKVDGDQVFRPEEAGRIRSVLSDDGHHQVIFPRINFCGAGRFLTNWANRDIVALRRTALHRDGIGFEVSSEKKRWGQLSFTREIREHRVTVESMLPVNYDCTFMTQDLVIDHWVNADSVYSRELSRPRSFDHDDRPTVLASFIDYHRRKRAGAVVRDDFHPHPIRGRIAALDPTMWGYDNFGSGTTCAVP